MSLQASDKVWVCERGHVDDYHYNHGGLCLVCGGEGMVPRAGEEALRQDSPTCPGCKGSGDEINSLCSRCGGTCEQFSLDAIAREFLAATQQLEQLLGAIGGHRNEWAECYLPDGPGPDDDPQLAQVWNDDQKLYAAARKVRAERGGAK